MSLRNKVAAVFCATLVLTPVIAEAQSAPVSVKANMARILRISAPAATVIIGNPAVADVTIQDPQTLVLTGKSYGSTNLIVLNNRGEPIADTMIDVVQDSAAEVVTVYMGSTRTSMACDPTCQPTIMLGDDYGYTRDTVRASRVISAAAGQ